MKLLSLALLLLALLAIPAAAQPGVSGNTDGVTLVAERGSHATIELSPGTRAAFLLSGTLLDAAKHPMVGAEIRIVRFEVTGPAERNDNVKDLVPLDQLNAEAPPFVIKQTISMVTGKDGRFTLQRELPPGRYSLQVDWDEVPESSAVVRWNLRWENRGRGDASAS